MPYSFRDKLGMFLQRFKFLHPWLLEFSHEGPEGRKVYVNRINHMLTTPAKENR